MSRKLLALVLAFATLIANAKSIEQRYSSYLSDEGMVLFIRPAKLSQHTDLSGFTYDMTYTAGQDSITINCTVDMNGNEDITQFIIHNESKKIVCESVSTLYRDLKKKGYSVRITSKFPIKDIKEIFADGTPATFTFVTTDKKSCSASYKNGQWTKERNDITRIFNSFKP